MSMQRSVTLPCSLALHRCILFIAVLFTVGHSHNAASALQEHSHKDESKSLSQSREQPRLDDDPDDKTDKEEDDDEEETDPKKKKKALEKDATGSPTTKDMKKIDKAIRKTQKIYEWPLGARLCLVAAILSLPILTIAVCVRSVPETEDLATSVYVKTAIHCGFSFSIGWINCIMLLRYKVFATMMVGNTILMGVAFVCNGGFSTALEDSGQDFWYWQGPQVKALCPAQFENAGHYAFMIFLFLVGAFIQGICYKSWGLSSRAFAPFCALIIIIVEMLEYFGVIHDSKLDVYMLSPVFGIIVSISLNCGVGGVPWSATGNMTSAGFNLAGSIVDFVSAAIGVKPATDSSSNIEKVVVNVCLWVSFVSGICMGTFFHSNRTVIFNALYMQGLLYFNGMVFQPIGERKPLLPSNLKDKTQLMKEQAQADPGCAFPPAPPSAASSTDPERPSLPRIATAQVFMG